MRVRTVELRLLALLLTALWTAGGVAVVTGYRPGGPVDLLVGVVAFLPALIASAGAIWPPVADGRSASLAVRWLGVLTALLVAPAVAGLLPTLGSGGGQPVLPSAEVAYAILLGLAGTCVFTGLGIASAWLRESAPRLRRVVTATLLGAAMTGVVATAFSGAVVANEAALRAQRSAAATPGPADPASVPPPCDGELRAAQTARVEVVARARLAQTQVGRVVLRGARNGADERWEAERSGTPDGPARAAYVSVDGRGWRRSGFGRWQPAAAPVHGTLDRRLVEAALGREDRVAAEHFGLEVVGDARARHCRRAVDGPAALEAFPALRWLAGEDLLETGRSLDVWRGELDWWVFEDGEVGMATVAIHGPPGSRWAGSRFQVTLEAQLTAVERGKPHQVTPPSE